MLQANRQLLKKGYTVITRDFTSLGNPFILFFIATFALRPGKELWLTVGGLVVIELIGNLIKLLWHKERPLPEPFSTRLGKMSSGSFPSLHAARSAFVFFVIAASTSSAVIRVASVFLIFVIALTRVIIKKHFVVDLFGGFALALLVYFSLLAFGF